MIAALGLGAGTSARAGASARRAARAPRPRRARPARGRGAAAPAAAAASAADAAAGAIANAADVNAVLLEDVRGAPAPSDAAADDDASDAGGPERRHRLLRDIAKFSLPVMLLPLADPLMSLVDTVCLGKMAGTLELASLAPATLITSFCFYTFAAPLSIATVAEVSAHLRDAPERASTAVSAALALAAGGGAAVAAFVLVFGPVLLRATGCDAALLPAAGVYLRIRALAFVSSAAAPLVGLSKQKTSLNPTNQSTNPPTTH
jgi:hypothetical protein